MLGPLRIKQVTAAIFVFQRLLRNNDLLGKEKPVNWILNA